MNKKDTQRTTGELNDSVGRLLRLAEPPVPIDPAATTRVENTVRAAWQSKVRATQQRRKRGLYILQFVAACLVLGAIGLFQKQNGASVQEMPSALIEKIGGEVSILAAGDVMPIPAEVGVALEPGSTLIVGAGGVAALALPDGMSVRLDRDSRLIYRQPDLLGLESGAVYVDTGHEGEHGPGLVVQTSRGDIRDIGTQFEVRLDTDNTRVRVREGKIVWTYDGLERMALKGSQLLMNSAGRVERSEIPLHGSSWDWVQHTAPTYNLNGRTLTDFLSWVVRENGWELTYADGSLAQEAAGIVLTGSTDALTPAQSLEAVLPTCGMTFELVEGRLSVNSVDAGQP